MAQLPPVYVSPSSLVAGGGGQSLAIDLQASISFTVRWNGQARTLTAGPATQPMALSLNLTAADLATPQLATLTLFDAQAGLLIATIYVPVAYNVVPDGIAVDSAGSKLYIATSATSSDPQFPPNSVIAIDLSTGIFLGTIKASASLGQTAISGDGSALYQVVLPNTIERISTASLTVAGTFTAPGAVSGLCVMPGSNTTIAARYQSSNSSSSIAIFDNGVARSSPAASNGTTNPVFSPDGTFLFEDTYGGFARYPVASNGPGAGVVTQGNTPLAVTGSSLYTSGGTIFNWQTLLPTGNLGAIGAPVADLVNNRVLLLTGNDGSPLLQAFDLNPLTPLTEQALGGLPVQTIQAGTGLGASTRLYRFGMDGLVAMYPQANFYGQGNVLVFHTVLAGPAPSVAANGSVSSADFQTGAVAPGELVSIFGSTLGSAVGASFTVIEGGTVIPPEGNVEVWFGEKQGTVLFNYSGQINAIAPFELQPGTNVNLQVWNSGIPSATIPLTVAATAPALFTRDGTGAGLVAMFNQDGTVNAPAPAGSIVTLFGTGGGVVAGGVDGRLAFGAANLSAAVQVTIGGLNAQVAYAGAAPDLVNGVFQLNVQMPQGLQSGSTVPVVVSIGGVSSPKGVTIAVR